MSVSETAGPTIEDIQPVAPKTAPSAEAPAGTPAEIDVQPEQELKSKIDAAIREAFGFGVRPDQLPAGSQRDSLQAVVNFMAVSQLGGEVNPATGHYKITKPDGTVIEGDCKGKDTLAYLETITSSTNEAVTKALKTEAKRLMEQARTIMATKQAPLQTEVAIKELTPDDFQQKFRGVLRLKEELSPQELQAVNAAIEDFRGQEKSEANYTALKQKIEPYQKELSPAVEAKQKLCCQDILQHLDPATANLIDFTKAEPDQLQKFILEWVSKMDSDKKRGIQDKLGKIGSGLNFWKILMAFLLVAGGPINAVVGAAEEATKP